MNCSNEFLHELLHLQSMTSDNYNQIESQSIWAEIQLEENRSRIQTGSLPSSELIANKTHCFSQFVLHECKSNGVAGNRRKICFYVVCYCCFRFRKVGYNAFWLEFCATHTFWCAINGLTGASITRHP